MPPILCLSNVTFFVTNRESTIHLSSGPAPSTTSASLATITTAFTSS